MISIGIGGAPPPAIVIYDVPMAVSLNPTQVVMAALAAVTFVATISGGGEEDTVTWLADGIAGGDSTVGTIVAGLYTAPWQAGNHVVTASVPSGDTTVFANASVNVTTTAPAVTVQATVPTEASYIGALVFNSVTAVLYVYTSTGWVSA